MPNGHRYELVDGQLVERSMGAQASRIATILLSLLEQHATTRNLGWAFTSDCGYQIFPERPSRVRFPDGSFIRRGRLPDDKPPPGHVRINPDLLFEVVSPNDGACEVEEKIDEYLRVGVPLIWVIFPGTRRVMVYRAAGPISRLGVGDELAGEEAMPGFACRVADLFAGL